MTILTCSKSLLKKRILFPCSQSWNKAFNLSLFVDKSTFSFLAQLIVTENNKKYNFMFTSVSLIFLLVSCEKKEQRVLRYLKNIIQIFFSWICIFPPFCIPKLFRIQIYSTCLSIIAIEITNFQVPFWDPLKKKRYLDVAFWQKIQFLF